MSPDPQRQVGDYHYCAVNRRLIMNAHLNAAGRLFGGTLMAWIDESAALYCMDELGTHTIVTKKISEVIFNEPAFPGDIVEFLCRTQHLGRTSITLEVLAMTRPVQPQEQARQILRCDIVFVALDRNGRPAPHNLGPLEG